MGGDDLIRRGDALASINNALNNATGDLYGAYSAIAALPAVTVGVQERVQHKKRGSTYRVLGRGKVQTDTPLTDYAEVVVYKGEADGLVWVRPVGEFDDGRFAALDLTPVIDAQAIREAALREARQRVNALVAEREADLHGAQNDFNRGAVDALQEACSAILALIGTTAEGGA